MFIGTFDCLAQPNRLYAVEQWIFQPARAANSVTFADKLCGIPYSPSFTLYFEPFLEKIEDLI